MFEEDVLIVVVVQESAACGSVDLVVGNSNRAKYSKNTTATSFFPFRG